MSIDFNEEKFKELILYIARECVEDVFFGATKLNKILFFSDFIAYATTGKPITGAEYVAIEHGPAPRRLVPIREEMIMDGDVKTERRGSQERVIAVAPRTYEFPSEERAIIDTVIDWLRFKDAAAVSELTHKLLAWQAAWAESLMTGKNTVIPYNTAFVSNQIPPQEAVEEVLELARSHGWVF